MVFLIVCGFGCVESNASFDHTHYLHALQNPTKALGSCDAIVDEEIQGECLLFAAVEGKYGNEACVRARSIRWQEACFFEVIDTNGISDQQAKDACAKTGRFQNRCVYHIIQREEQELMERFPLGAEQELATWIRQEIQEMGGRELPNDPLSHTLVSRIIARRFRKEWGGNHTLLFPSIYCGNASKEECSLAYRFVVRLGRDIPCSFPPIVSDLRQANVPLWDASFHEEALLVWSELCPKKK